MDKNKTLNDFLVLNQSLITNMESQSPEIKKAFDLVLEQIKAKFEIVEPIASSIKKEFKVGDKVFIPSTISGFPITDLSTVRVIEKATENTEKYLIIDKIVLNGNVKEYLLTDMLLTPSVIYFYEQDLVPYVELKVGDKVKFPTTYKHEFNKQPLALREAIERGQDYLYVVDLDSILFCDLSPSLDGIVSSTYYINDLNLVPYEEPMQSSNAQIKLYTTEEKKEIPQEIVDKMLENQLAQTGKKDINIFVENVNMGKSGGGFNYNETKEGHPFWYDIVVAGDFDKFYEKYPKTKTTKFKVGDKVKIPTTNAFGIDLSLSEQIEKAKNDGQDYLYVRRIDFEGDYVLTAQIYGINGELFKEEDLELYEEPNKISKFKVGDKVKIPTTNAFGYNLQISQPIIFAKNKGQDYLYVKEIDSNGNYVIVQDLSYKGGQLFSESDLEAYEEPTQAVATPKPFNPYDFVGKTLSLKGKKYLITKLLKINSKTIRYEFELNDGTKEIYDVPKNVLKIWLEGKFYQNGIIIQSAQTPQPQVAPITTPTPTLPTTPTKEWTPQDLVGKYLKYRISDRTFYVEKLVRNNPKNKSYLITDINTKKSIQYSYNMREISKWLDGGEFRGVMIVDNPSAVTTQPTTQPSLTATKTFTKPFDFQIGDKVALPKTYNGKELVPSDLMKLSPSYKEAKYEDQNYLYVRGIDYRDGKVSLAKPFVGGNADLFDFVDIKPYEEPKKATAPIVVQTKVEGDYSTYSQFDLKEEKNEIEATLPYLDEDDEEYNELKLKLEMIDLWLD